MPQEVLRPKAKKLYGKNKQTFCSGFIVKMWKSLFL